MANYIAFFDLLGIKDIASYNTELYFENINSFQQALKECSSILQKNQHQIKAFSDCAYIECDDIILLFDYFKSLREVLFLKQIFFNAAITKGTLNSSPQINNSGNFVCLSFQSPETVKVYSMQTLFTGIGVYIDKEICKELEYETKQHYVTKSAYCIYDKEETFNRFENYFDLKYDNLSKILVKFLLMNFIKTLALNKRAARYYLSAIYTCVSQLSYDELIHDYLPIFLNKKTFLKNSTIFNDLLPIYLILINQVYNAYRHDYGNDDVNYNICDTLNEIIDCSPLSTGFDNLQLYSDKLLSKENKYQFTDYISKRILETLHD